MQRRFEREPVSGREYLDNLRLAGSTREVRRALHFSAFATWAVGIGGLVMMFSAAGPNGTASRLLYGLLIASTVVVGALWLRGPWPGATVSLLFCVYADVGIALFLTLLDSPLIALAGAIWFGLVSEYISLTETARVLLVHSISVAIFVLYLGSRSVMEPGSDTAASAYLLLAVLFVVIASPLIRYVISNSMRKSTIAAEALAHSDVLTGLINRRGLQAALPALVHDAKVAGNWLLFAVIDLDSFKAVNDSYGHEHGDEVLRRVGQRLKDAVRATDCVARIGGEEFVVVAPVHQQNITALSERLVDAVSRDTDPYAITGSLGAVVVLRTELRERDLIEASRILIGKADQAMYRAKRNGGNQAVVEQGWAGEAVGLWSEDHVPE